MSAIALDEVPGCPPRVRAAFTTRTGGESSGHHASLNLGSTCGDDPAHVRTNRLALADAVGFDGDRAATLTQVHGATVVAVGPLGGGGTFVGSLDGHAAADGMVTSAPGVALLVQGADCVPIVGWSADASTVMGVHAGWRGLMAGVVEAGAAALGTPGGIAIGACIGPCCYPVDGDLREAMAIRFGNRAVCGQSVDLRWAARAALVAAGIPSPRIVDVGGCTSCDADRYFSHRRDAGVTGRQAGLIWIEEER